LVLAAAVQVALLGPLPPLRPRRSTAIVMAATLDAHAERIQRGTAAWVVTAPYQPTTPIVPN
jgi:hypothetical protein